MLIDNAMQEARRLQASLRAMSVDRVALDEAELLCQALQHDPVESVVPFALDTLERIDGHLPAGTLAGLVRVRIRNLVGTLQTHKDRREQAEVTDGAALIQHAMAQAASNGTEAAFLTPAQAWAARQLAIPVERLQGPLPACIAATPDAVSQIEASQFRQLNHADQGPPLQTDEPMSPTSSNQG